MGTIKISKIQYETSGGFCREIVHFGNFKDKNEGLVSYSSLIATILNIFYKITGSSSYIDSLTVLNGSGAIKIFRINRGDLNKWIDSHRAYLNTPPPASANPLELVEAICLPKILIGNKTRCKTLFKQHVQELREKARPKIRRTRLFQRLFQEWKSEKLRKIAARQAAVRTHQEQQRLKLAAWLDKRERDRKIYEYLSGPYFSAVAKLFYTNTNEIIDLVEINWRTDRIKHLSDEEQTLSNEVKEYNSEEVETCFALKLEEATKLKKQEGTFSDDWLTKYTEQQRKRINAQDPRIKLQKIQKQIEELRALPTPILRTIRVNEGHTIRDIRVNTLLEPDEVAQQGKARFYFGASDQCVINYIRENGFLQPIGVTSRGRLDAGTGLYFAIDVRDATDGYAKGEAENVISCRIIAKRIGKITNGALAIELWNRMNQHAGIIMRQDSRWKEALAPYDSRYAPSNPLVDAEAPFNALANAFFTDYVNNKLGFEGIYNPGGGLAGCSYINIFSPSGIVTEDEVRRNNDFYENQLPGIIQANSGCKADSVIQTVVGYLIFRIE